MRLRFHSGYNLSVSGDHKSTSGCEVKADNLAVWQWICFLMGLFLMSAACVQHNDPDSFMWIPVYLIPAGISWIVSLKLFILNWHYKNIRKNSSTPVIITIPEASESSLLERLIVMMIVYSFFLGIRTLCHFLYREYIISPAGPYDLELELELTLRSSTLEVDMEKEEAKELVGLCIVILWLRMLKDSTFLKLGRWGLYFGVGLTLFPILTWIFLERIESAGIC